MSLDITERKMLAAVADVLIPAGSDYPSASEAGVAGDGLDQVLAVRPDLEPPLRALLAAAAGRVPADFVAELSKSNPAAFGVLAELVPGAYFLNPKVRESLGYHGQSPRPIEQTPDPEEDVLLRSVIERGPIYRPTASDVNSGPRS